MPGPSLDELRLAARYHRDRFALYRSRALTARATSGTKMRALQRAAEAAEERFRAAANRR